MSSVVISVRSVGKVVAASRKRALLAEFMQCRFDGDKSRPGWASWSLGNATFQENESGKTGRSSKYSPTHGTVSLFISPFNRLVVFVATPLTLSETVSDEEGVVEGYWYIGISPLPRGTCKR